MLVSNTRSLIDGWTPRRYEGPVRMFAATDVLDVFAHAGVDRGWAAWTSDLECELVPGGHQDFILAPHATSLAAALSATLSGRPGHRTATTALPDPRRHVYRHRPVLPVEQRLVDRHVRPGMQVLDIGTAATGRSATMLREAGAVVHSIEVNAEAMAEFAAGEERHGIHLAIADMVALPYTDDSFDVVMIGLHGSDYLIDPHARAQAFAESARVLRPGGVFVFNAFNPAGLALSPSGLTSAAFLKVRARYVFTGRFARRTMIDYNGLELHQALPRRIVDEVERATGLRLRTVTNQSGSSTSRLLVGLLASAPYYVFVDDQSN